MCPRSHHPWSSLSVGKIGAPRLKARGHTAALSGNDLVCLVHSGPVVFQGDTVSFMFDSQSRLLFGVATPVFMLGFELGAFAPSSRMTFLSFGLLVFVFFHHLILIWPFGAQEQGLVSELMSHLVNEELVILQYADDTIFLIEDDLEKARNLKYVLCVFEQLSGLKINFHKSEIFCLGEAKEKVQEYKEIFSCKEVYLPLRYLGLPVDDKRLSNAQWGHAEEKIEKRMAGWIGNLLSIGDRVTLVNSCLSSIPLFMLSFLEAPKGVLKNMNSSRSRMVWQESQEKRRYHMVNWPTICMPKGCGGLGILDL